MTAAVLERQGGPLVLADDVDIEVPGYREVRVRVAATGLCHSDLSAIDMAEHPSRAGVPIIVGHETAGVVESVGDGVTALAVGDHVVVNPVAFCGTCYWCVRDEISLCEANSGMLTSTLPSGATRLSRAGEKVFRGLGVGGFAQYVVAPETSAVKIPDDIPLDLACLLACSIQTGVGAVWNTARMDPGATVLVMGLGSVGLSIVQGARLAGASVIVASDPVAARRELAVTMGATICVDPISTNVGHLVASATNGVGADYAFDAVGSGQLVADGLAAIRRGGTVVCVGGAYDDIVISPGRSLMMAEKKLVGSLVGGSHLLRSAPQLVSLLRAGQLNLEGLVTARRPLADINIAIEELRAGQGVRTVLVP